MSVPEGTGSGASPSLFVSLRAFWSVLVAILYTRLDLVTAELEDAAVHGLKFVLAALVSLLSLFVAFFFANFFVIAIFWSGPYRLCAIGAVFAVYLLIGLVLLAVARNMILRWPGFLSQTLAELKRDVDGLSKSIAPKKEETKP